MSKKISVISKIVLALTILGCIIPTVYLKVFDLSFLLYHEWLTHSAGLIIFICCIIVVAIGISGIFRKEVKKDDKAIWRVCTLLCVVACILYDLSILSDPAEITRRISCASNLKQMGLALQQYAMDYAGYFPQANGAVGLELLRKNDYLTDYTVYGCPSIKKGKGKDNQSLTEESVDYVYIGGLNTKSDPKQPLMYDKANNHGYYGNVLFADGTVQGIYGNPWTQNIKK